MENKKKTITLSDDNFKAEVLESKTPILVDFWAAWCGPCRAIAPAIEILSSEFEGRAKVGKLDVDNNPATASGYQVSSIPTLLFFKNGEIVDRVVGVVSKKVLSEKLDAILQPETVNS
ncbi:thioredoxin [Nitrospira defluvii]|nr:thioredoxin [Nitrospira defluvii]